MHAAAPGRFAGSNTEARSANSTVPHSPPRPPPRRPIGVAARPILQIFRILLRRCPKTSARFQSPFDLALEARSLEPFDSAQPNGSSAQLQRTWPIPPEKVGTVAEALARMLDDRSGWKS